MIYENKTVVKNASAQRIGRRIRDVRTLKGMTRKELGERINLDANRVQKYESGVRKPKRELMAQIANALGVDPLALDDPDISTITGVAYILFELESLWGLRVEPEKEEKGKYKLTFDDASANAFLGEWWMHNMDMTLSLYFAPTAAEKEKIISSYDMWEWTYADRSKTQVSREESPDLKTMIEEQIKRLQEELEKLENLE